MDVILLKIVLGYFVIMSVICYILMGVDKQRARRKEWRIPERVLLVTAFIGGGIGSFLGMYAFRHKTKHMKFVLSLPIAAAIYGYLIYQIILRLN